MCSADRIICLPGPLSDDDLAPFFQPPLTSDSPRRRRARRSGNGMLETVGDGHGRDPVDRAPQRLLRPDARALQGHQHRLRQALFGRARHRGGDQAVARRVGKPVAGRDRRPRSRRCHPRHLARCRGDRQGGARQGRLAAPLRQCVDPLPLGRRVRRPQRQSQGHRRLAGSRS